MNPERLQIIHENTSVQRDTKTLSETLRNIDEYYDYLQDNEVTQEEMRELIERLEDTREKEELDAVEQLKEGSAAEILERRRPGIVHRLDKETSGIIITAKNRDAEEFLQKRYNETELEQKNIDLKKYNINNITQNIEFNLEKIIKNTEKEITLIKEKFNELYDNLKKYHDLENSINDLNKYSELEVDKDIEESILKSKTFNIEDNSFPSFIKILSEKGDFHETLLKETLQNNNDENNNLYMSSVVQSNNELNK